MAYIKYKELTKYFYFYKELDISTLPKYVFDYVNEEEEVIRAYATAKDRSIFTTKRMILFDIRSFPNKKKIFIIPYKNISISSLQFGKDNATLLLYLISGNPLKIKFINLSPEDKIRLRKLYNYMADTILGFKQTL